MMYVFIQFVSMHGHLHTRLSLINYGINASLLYYDYTENFIETFFNKH